MLQWRIQNIAGGGRVTLKMGVESYYLAISRILHENERNWTERGRVLGSPLGSATELFVFDRNS